MKTTLLVVAGLLVACTGFGVEFHVDPAGDDSGAGSLEAPFATLHRAVAAARGTADALILVHGGVYLLEEPLEFGPEDSGLTVRAVEDALPVLSGGRPVTGWRRAGDTLWQTRIPEAAGDDAWRFEQLFVNGRRAVRARTPNRFYSYLKEVQETIIEAGDGRIPERAEQTLTLLPDDFRALDGLTDEALREVNIVLYHKWDITRRDISRVDRDTHAVVIAGSGMKSWNPLRPGVRYYLENFREALDTAGEWYLARDGVLYYHPLPGEDMETAEVMAPVLDRLVVFRGDAADGGRVEGITLRGLAFRHAASPASIAHFGPVQAAANIEAAVMADGARRIILEDCEIGHVGGYGLWFRGDCRDCTVQRTLVHDLGAGGVRIGEQRQAADTDVETAFIVLDNNIIRQGGRLYPCAVGVWVGFSPDNRITHNDIADFFYTGISVGWRWGYEGSSAKRNTIAFNRVRHIGQGALSDMGGIYTLGPSEGTVVHDNVFHAIHAYGYGGWGLYTDEGSTGILFENNLVYDVKTGGFHQHFGRENVLRNNILAFSELYQLQATRVEDHLSFTLENNLVFWERGVLLQGPFDRLRFESRNNCYWHAGGEPVRFSGRPLEEWQAEGHEEGSMVADPGFRAPADGDFTLAENSPALAIGFVPFDSSRAGVYGDASWTRRAEEYEYPALHLPPPPPEGIPKAD